MVKNELIERIKKLTLRILIMADHLPENKAGQVIMSQILRSATSVGANYRAACLAKSSRDFVNKLKIVEEELDETIYWLELIEEGNYFKSEKIDGLKEEARQLFAIIVSSLKTAKMNMTRKSRVEE